MKKSLSPIFKLPFQIDSEQLLKLLHEKNILCRLTSAGNLSLMHREGAEDPWLDGLTKTVLTANEEIPFSERDFKKFNPGLNDTYFEACQHFFERALLKRLGRVRLFQRFPQTSSSLHRDLDVRLHVALKTNKNAFIVFPDSGIFQIPNDGHIYLVNTTMPHFAVNTDPIHERLHVVCSSYCGFVEERKDEARILSSNLELFRSIIEKYSAIEVDPVNTR